MNGLEIRDCLAELAEVEEDNIAAGIGDSFLTDACLVEKVEKYALDRVLAPALLIWVGQGRLRCGGTSNRTGECARFEVESRSVPGAFQCSFVDPGAVRDEVEEVTRRS